MTDARSARTSSRFPLRWVLRVFAAVAALALLAWWLPADELLSAILAVPPVAWPMAIAVYLTGHAAGVVKWRLLVNTAGAALRWRPAAHAYYWGLFGNLFLPSIVGGDIVRAGVALRHARSKSGLLLGSLVDRIQDVVALCVLAAVGALLSPQALDATSQRILWASFAVVTGMALVGLLLLRYFPARRTSFRARRRMVKIRHAVRATAARPQAMLASFTLGLMLQTSLVVLNWQLGRLMGIDVPLFVWAFVWPLAKIAALTPLTQGGIGIREAAQAVLFAPFGVSAVRAVAVGLVFEAVIILGGLLSGLIALVLRNGATQPRDTAASMVQRARS